MNKQEDFDRVVAHARKQNCRAVAKNGFCQYRTDDGKKCFIGALIPDNQYHYSMEGVNLSLILEKIDRGRDTESYYFYKQLQGIHDFIDLSASWEDRFKQFAEKWNLIYTPPA